MRRRWDLLRVQVTDETLRTRFEKCSHPGGVKQQQRQQRYLNHKTDSLQRKSTLYYIGGRSRARCVA